MTDREPLSTDPYKGVRDFYPADWARLSRAFSMIRTRLGLWGYEEYNASPLERSEIYEKKSSEEIVSEQTYTFEDRGGRRVTLRPEMTPTLARMVAGKRRELPLPLRWYSIPNCFRYERPQKGRLREHFQLNVDLVGISGSEADVEIINVAASILRAFGAQPTDFVIRVNSRELLTAATAAVGLSSEQSRVYLRLLDKKDKMSASEFASASKEIAGDDPLELIQKRRDQAVIDAVDKVEDLIRTLAERGVDNVVFDPTITRGFDYYTGTIFEVFDRSGENTRSLFGGGRYDGLVAAFGGDPVPAIGFGMGDVTLMDFLTTHNLLPGTTSGPTLYLGTPTSEDIGPAQLLARDLRALGLSIFVNLTTKSLGDQVKDADRRGIPYFAAYGAEERDSASLKIKDLGAGTVEEIPVTGVVARLTSVSSHTD